MADLETVFNNISAARKFVIWTMALEARRKNNPDDVLSAIGRINKITTPRDRQAAAKLLRWAVNNDHVKVAKKLLEKGANPDTARMFGDGTVLCDAVTMGRIEMAKALLEKGASVNRRMPPWMNSPMHMAVSHNRGDMVELLLEYDADLTIRDAQGRTPIDLARQLHVPKARKVLEEYVSFGHARQIKNVYKTNRNKRPQGDKGQQNKAFLAAVHL